MRFCDLQGEPKDETVSVVSPDGAFTLFGEKVGVKEPTSAARGQNDKMAEYLQGFRIWEWKIRAACALEEPNTRIGRWPEKHTIKITVTTTLPGESVEAEIEAQVYPEGIWFDTEKIKESWIRKDRIVIDTTDYLNPKAADPQIRPAEVTVGVAYRNRYGKGDLDIPTDPGEWAKPFFHLEPAVDDLSRKTLDPIHPKLTHRIAFRREKLTPVYDPLLACLEREKDGITTMILEPMATLIATDKETEVQGWFTLGYDRNGLLYSENILFGFTGVAEDENNQDISIVRKQILNLIQVMQLQDIPAVDDILRQFGPDADPSRSALGPKEAQKSLQKHTVELLMEVVKNPDTTLQRLVFIKKALFNAGKIYWGLESDKAITRAVWYDWWIGVCETTRWINDMAFAALWYAVCIKMCKGNPRDAAKLAALSTPMMSLLKKYLLDVPWGEMAERGILDYQFEGPSRTMSQAELDKRTSALFVTFATDILAAMEDTMFAALGVVVLGGLPAITSVADVFGTGIVLAMWLGGVMIMMFIRHKTLHPNYDNYTLFKAMLADFSVGLLKAFFLAFLMKWLTDPPQVTQKLKQATEKLSLGDQISQKFDSFIPNFRTFLTKFMGRYEKSLADAASATGVFVKERIVRLMPSLPPEFVQVLTSDANPLPGTLHGILWDYVKDHDSLGVGKAFDTATDAAVKTVDAAQKGYLYVPVTIDGQTIFTQIHVLDAGVKFTEFVFEAAGLNALKSVNFKGLLPEKMEYKKLDEVIVDMDQIPGAEREVAFLSGKADKSVYDNGGVEKGKTVEAAMRSVLEEIESA